MLKFGINLWLISVILCELTHAKRGQKSKKRGPPKLPNCSLAKTEEISAKCNNLKQSIQLIEHEKINCKQEIQIGKISKAQHQKCVQKCNEKLKNSYQMFQKLVENQRFETVDLCDYLDDSVKKSDFIRCLGPEERLKNRGKMTEREKLNNRMMFSVALKCQKIKKPAIQAICLQRKKSMIQGIDEDVVIFQEQKVVKNKKRPRSTDNKSPKKSKKRPKSRQKAKSSKNSKSNSKNRG